MVLADNIIIPRSLQNSIDRGTLTISDHLLLALAGFAAGLFPDAEIYIGAQQQEVNLPAVFVDYYSLTNQKRLTDMSEYRFGLDITYVPTDRLNRHELQDAIFRIQQNLDSLQSPIGPFVCYSKDSDTTDDLAHVTGIVSVWEQTASNGEIIQQADQTIKPKE